MKSINKLLIMQVLLSVVVQLHVGCSSILVNSGIGFDAGSLGVSGVQTGIGPQSEILGYSGPDMKQWGMGVSIKIAGYSTSGDADPIAFTTLEGRFRKLIGEAASENPYWELGSGGGVAWSPSIHHAAVPVQAEIGYQTLKGRFLVNFGIRERFILLIGSGSPPLDAFNSVQLVVGVGFRP